MKIEQFITSPSIGFFESGFQKKWNLSKYFDDTKPLFFFGFRGLENVFEKHKGYKVVLPSTPTDLPNFEILKNVEKTILITECSLPKGYYLPENVIHKQEVIEIKDYTMFNPSTLGDKIYYYSGFLNGWTPNPKETIDYIQSKIDYEIITTQHINLSDLRNTNIEFLIENYYRKCFLNLNFSQGHGMTTTREFSLMGVKTLTFENPYPYESLIKCKDVDEVLENIKLESKKINTIQPSINPHTTGKDWLELDYWIKNKNQNDMMIKNKNQNDMILKMRGSFNTEGLLDLIDYIPNNLIMAEVGCYAGESTKMFLESGKITLLYAIDIWEDEMDNFKKIQPNHDFSVVEKIFDEDMKKFNIKKLKMHFSEALESLPTLDFIYIDANHDYEFVKDDITNALKKIKKDGLIAGHDYNNESPGVIKAVNEFFGKPDIIFSDSSWLVKIN